jgi:diphthamide synthase (EF-2-diphthine--ammonia ligase)
MLHRLTRRNFIVHPFLTQPPKRQMTLLSKEIEDIHAAAVRKGKDSYTDPSTGYQVLTRKFLQDRGTCCGNACRHCPFGHMNVKNESSRQNVIDAPILINMNSATMKNKYRNKDVSILFWSGGKDSYLTYRHLKKMRPETPLILMTTFGIGTQMASIQNVHVQDIVKQAKYLQEPCCFVPLTPNGSDYQEAVLGAIESVVMAKSLCNISSVSELIFGDLRLEDILQWRRETFGKRFKVTAPLFGKSYDELLRELWAARDEEGFEIFISATEVKDLINVGDVYDEDFVNGLPSSIDLMGENGEFHTLIKFQPDE